MATARVLLVRRLEPPPVWIAWLQGLSIVVGHKSKETLLLDDQHTRDGVHVWCTTLEHKHKQAQGNTENQRNIGYTP